MRTARPHDRASGSLPSRLGSSWARIERELRQFRALVWLLRRSRSDDPRVAPGARLQLLEMARSRFFPEYRLTDFRKVWWRDEAFFENLEKVHYERLVAAERPFLLRELLKLVSHLDGDTAEAGVYRGACSWLICNGRRGRRSTHHGFDSFEGLSRPVDEDGDYWRVGDLSVDVNDAARLLEPFNAVLHKGWIPEVFGQAEIESLVFAHIDVDLYEPTLASLEYFYPRLVPGGILLCDDYGYETCPGQKRAVDDFMRQHPEPVIHSPTGQAFILKR